VNEPAADVCFELGDDSSRPFRSLVAPLCLAQALVVSTGHQLAAAAARRKARRAPRRNGRTQ
jgi:DNA-binding MurR/RpiR family transcriptional regulator